jgi:hypothetical protein
MTNGMTVLLNSEKTPCHQYCFQKVAKKSNPNVRELKALGHIISPRGHQQPTEHQLSSKPRPSKVGVYYLIDFGHVPAGMRALSHPHLTVTAATTTATVTLLALHNAVDYLIVRHPKVLSTVSTVLTTLGGIILFPGVSACAGGTILAHPAVTIAGGIALALGRQLRRALNSAAAQAQASGQVALEDVGDHRGDRTEPDGLLSVNFVV